MRNLLKVLVAVILAGTLTLSAAAQAPPAKDAAKVEEHSMPMPEYTIAFLAIVLIMLLVCTPSRKAYVPK